MDQLPGETLQKVFLLLDPVSVIKFGVCSIRLQSFLSDPHTFRRFIENIKLEVWSWEGEAEEMEGEAQDIEEEIDFRNECECEKKQENIAVRHFSHTVVS